MAGRFITLEGGEGSGKSTQVKRLAAALEAKGIAVVTTREPGGSPGAEEIRKLLVEGEPGRWDAAHRDAAGLCRARRHVRAHHRSGLAGGQMGDLATASPIPLMPIRASGRGVARETIRRIDSVVLDDFKPDLTLMLDLDVETGLEARRGAGRHGNPLREVRPRFPRKAAPGFLDIAKRNPDRCAVIDAAGSPKTRSAASGDFRRRQRSRFRIV